MSDLPKSRDASFDASQRLRTRRELEAVFACRCSAAGDRLLVFGRPNDLGFNRLGVSVGRKHGNAVRRVRFKRLCREAFRLSKLRQPKGWDWVIAPVRRAPVPLTEVKSWNLAEVMSEFLRLTQATTRRARRRNRSVDPPAN